ncbi:MAG: histidinol dehydrogenase [Phycisphaerales bacterium]
MSDTLPSKELANPGALRILKPSQVQREIKPAVQQKHLDDAGAIINQVRTSGERAIRQYAEMFNERTEHDPLLYTKDQMQEALQSLDPLKRKALERAANRIERFAAAQRASVQDLTIDIPGGQSGHTICPIESAGCYAPAGRYPLPSTVLMTAITARVAGCKRVVVASPGADPIMLAAAAIAGADQFLAVGGPHAIAAMALGFDGFPRCDFIAGPGNAWVTAAKQLLSGTVGIDMLAGPSELLVVCDDSADPVMVAADVLAQAEHDPEAVPMVVSTSASLADAINTEIQRQVLELNTRDVAIKALNNGFIVVAESMDQAVGLTNVIAPEHLELITDNAQALATEITNAGAIFIGQNTPEVLGDYGAGPNHTLPTGSTARFSAGLSVINFLRFRTWIRIDNQSEAQGIFDDTCQIAQMEGLDAHHASALARNP